MIYNIYIYNLYIYICTYNYIYIYVWGISINGATQKWMA